MKRIGYVLLAVATLAWVILMIRDLVKVFPLGVIGLVALAGLAFLFGHVVKTKLENVEDRHYTKNVKQ